MIKRILVAFDASPRSAVRLQVALSLAAPHESEVTALYTVMPAVLSSPWLAGEGMIAAAGQLAQFDEEQRARALDIFRQATATGLASWLDGGDVPYASLLRQALVHDLVVLGQADLSDHQTGALPVGLLPAVITDSGRPALVVPADGRFEGTDGPVLVAWKPTRESARALLASLPWLRRAPEIHLATASDADAHQPPLAAIEHWMKLQGVRSPVRRHELASGDVGETLLALGEQLGAALLVMGCYGHSRAREWALGGVTRTILRSMSLPVLMVH